MCPSDIVYLLFTWDATVLFCWDIFLRGVEEHGCTWHSCSTCLFFPHLKQVTPGLLSTTLSIIGDGFLATAITKEGTTKVCPPTLYKVVFFWGYSSVNLLNLQSTLMSSLSTSSFCLFLCWRTLILSIMFAMWTFRLCSSILLISTYIGSITSISILSVSSPCNDGGFHSDALFSFGGTSHPDAGQNCGFFFDNLIASSDLISSSCADVRGGPLFAGGT